MKYILALISIALLILSSWLYFKLSDKNNLEPTIRKARFINSIYKSNQLLQYNSESNELARGIEIKSLQNESILLDSLVKNGKKKLIFRLSEKHCDVCVNQELKFIKKLMVNGFTQDIVILASFDRFQKFRAFCRTNKLSDNAYFIEKGLDNIPLEDAEVPFLFLLDDGLKLDLVFIPSRDLPDNSKSYYYTVFDNFFGKKVDFIFD